MKLKNNGKEPQKWNGAGGRREASDAGIGGMLALIVLIAALWQGWHALSAGLLGEDMLLVAHPIYLREGWTLASSLNPVLIDPSWMWRPASMWTVAAQLSLRIEPWKWHLASLALWALMWTLAALAAQKWARLMGASAKVAGLSVGAAVLTLMMSEFVAQPAWTVGGRFESMAGIWMGLAAMLAAKKSLGEKSRAWALAIGWLLASWSYEPAWGALAALLALSWAAPEWIDRKTMAQSLAIAGLIWLASRLGALGLALTPTPWNMIDWAGASWGSIERIGALTGALAPMWPGRAPSHGGAWVALAIAQAMIVALTVGVGLRQKWWWSKLAAGVIAALALAGLAGPLEELGGIAAASAKMGGVAPWALLALASAMGQASKSIMGQARSPAQSKAIELALSVLMASAVSAQAMAGKPARSAWSAEVALWEAALAADSRNAMAASNLMLTLSRSGEERKAREIGAQFVSRIQEQSEWSRWELSAMASRAALLLASKDERGAEEAEKSLVRALPFASVEPQVAINYAAAAMRLSKWEEALAASRFALSKAKPGALGVEQAGTLWRQVAQAQNQLGRSDQAREALEQALKLEKMRTERRSREQAERSPKSLPRKNVEDRLRKLEKEK